MIAVLDFRFVLYSKYFCGDACNSGIVRHRFIHNGISPNGDIIAYRYPSEYYRTLGNIYVIAYFWNTREGGIASADSYLLAYHAVFSDFGFSMYYDTHTAITAFCAAAY